MKLDDLAGQCGEWLRGVGPDSDIVVSTRIRLARNLAGYPFVRQCSDYDQSGIVSQVRDVVTRQERLRSTLFVDVTELNPIDRQFLVERQLISRELSVGKGARGALIDLTEKFSIMINEEDHLRLQVMNSGLDLDETWNQINQLDADLDENLPFSFSESLGYLTACPTNVGTGMRVSVMLHLPALVITREIERVFRSLQKMALAVRGAYGEGSRATGDFYQISNQTTLGSTETELIEKVREIVDVLIRLERRAREFLVKESNETLHERILRAYGILCSAPQISSEETLQLLSSVRMGINLGVIQHVEIPTVNKLFIETQPAHLEKLRGPQVGGDDWNVERAQYLQEHLRHDEPPAGEPPR